MHLWTFKKQPLKCKSQFWISNLFFRILILFYLDFQSVASKIGKKFQKANIKKAEFFLLLYFFYCLYRKAFSNAKLKTKYWLPKYIGESLSGWTEFTANLLNPFMLLVSFYTPWNIRKPKVFCFHGIYKETSNMEWVYLRSC